MTLPPGYVGTATQLGYATTVHTAQGVSVDTMHGLATGAESRQLLYTMLSRDRAANHLYLPVVGDGDPHAILKPDNLRASTATELLEQILARDATAASATTLQRDQHDPVVQLGHATARYLDALHIGAEHVAGTQPFTDLDRQADQLINGLTNETTWPALRTRLLLIAATGADPVATLRAAAQLRELDCAADRAAILNWRLDDTHLRNPAAPLPWLPGIPAYIATNPDWGPYLAARGRLIIDLADQVRAAERAAAPSWAVERRFLPSADLVAEIQVWRAAMQVQPADLRPSGPIQSSLLARTWQLRLDKQLVAADIAQDQQWTDLLVKRIPNVIKDSFLPSLVDRLDRLDRAGFDATGLVRSAAARVRYPMITRQLLSGGAFWTNYPSDRQTTQSSKRWRWRVSTLRDLGLSDIARRGDLELMANARRARAARRPTGSHATHWEIRSRWASLPNRDAIGRLAGGQWGRTT